MFHQEIEWDKFILAEGANHPALRHGGFEALHVYVVLANQLP